MRVPGTDRISVPMRTTLFSIFVLLFFPCESRASIKSWDAEVAFVNFSPSQKEKVHAAIALIREIVTSDEFRERVLNHTVNGKTTFVDNRGLSNEEIYKKIAEGAEIMGETSKNGTMDVELELFHSPTKTIGYTYPDTNRIWMNTKYFDSYTVIKVADNLMHEWMHKLGFDHDKTYSVARNYSVPYAIGYLVEELAQKKASTR